MPSLSKIIEFISLPITYISIFLCSCSVFMFSPERILKYFGLLEIRNKYKSQIGIIFVLSISVLLVKGFLKLLKFLNSSHNIKKVLKSLNYSEKEIILHILNNDSKIININEGLHINLENNNIIYRAVNTDPTATNLAFCLNARAKNYLKNNLNLLDLEKTLYSETNDGILTIKIK